MLITVKNNILEICKFRVEVDKSPTPPREGGGAVRVGFPTLLVNLGKPGEGWGRTGADLYNRDPCQPSPCPLIS